MNTNNQHTLQISTLLNGKYKILKILGHGGFGITYQAQHIYLAEKQVVIKEFFLSGKCVRGNNSLEVQTQGISQNEFENFKKRFLAEAQILSKLKNVPHTLEVFDFFEENNTGYLVMPFVEAEDLGKYLSKQPENRISEKEALAYFAQIAAALEAIHKANILHRDIKPANILIGKNGEAYLIDFGAAREFIAEGISQTMTAILTPGYAPLEQYDEHAKRGVTMDIYAMGALLYRMLMGKTPMAAVSRVNAVLVPPMGISTHVSAVIMKAMDMDVVNRFQTVGEMREALRGSGTKIIVKPTTKMEDTETEWTESAKTEKRVEVLEKKIPNLGEKYKFRWLDGVVILLVIIGISTAIALFLSLLCEKTYNYIVPEMVEVQGGTFEMGDVFGEGNYWEKPVHIVTIRSFEIGKYEVSFAEYDLFCEANGKQKPKDEGWGRGNMPVINVSWEDATSYCKWLSIQTGKKYHLLTEAQWEYAAREEGKKVRFGNGKNIADPSEMNFDGLAACKDYSILGLYRQKTTCVNSFSHNSLGLYNMSGNVSEWCREWDRTNHNIYDPVYFSAIRGGSWLGTASGCRVASRGTGVPSYSDRTLGFRLSRTK